MSWLSRVLVRLTEPSPAVTAPNVRVAVRVHAGIVLTLSASTFLSGLGTFLPGPGEVSALRTLRWLAFGASLLWLGVYRLVRSRHYRVAVVLWLCLQPALVLGAVLHATVPEVVYAVSMSYLLVTIASSTLLFGPRVVGVVTAGCVAVVVGAAWLSHVPLSYSVPVVAFLLTGTAMVLASAAVARASERATAEASRALEQETAQRHHAEQVSSRLHEALERTSEFVFAFSEDLGILEANRAARAALGLPETADALRRALDADALARLRVAMVEARQSGQWEGTLTLTMRGEAVSMSAVVLAHPAAARWPAYFSGILRDGSVERRLRHLERMESIGQLAGGVAHDFNNALSAIRSSAEVLKRSLTKPQDLEDIELILQATTKSAQLTKKLLTLARRSSTGAQQSVDVHGLLDETASMLRRTLPKNISVQLELGAETPLVVGDAVELEHVFLNLAVNARDAMPEGGRLTLRTRVVELEPAFAAQHPPLVAGPHLRVDVVDTGEGMSPQTAERIFEPFFTTKGQGKGTGLGLASVYGTMRAHRGAVMVESALKRGATFTLFFPLGPAPEAVPHPTAPLKALAGVLIIDDDALVREATRRLLALHANTVLEASGGEEGLAVFEANRATVEVVVLDLVMPGLDGSGTFTQLRALAPDVPVVLVSGFTHDVRVHELLRAPRVAFVAKPVREETLRAALGRVLAPSPSAPVEASAPPLPEKPTRT